MNFLHFDSLREIPHLRHAVTMRAGGVSQAEYSMLNLAFHVGDNENRVRENRALLSSTLGYDVSTLVAAQQVHGANSQIATPEYSGRGAMDWDSALPDCDALIVGHRNIPAMILVADCAPILLADPARGVLAVVHAGWRGAVGKVASNTLQKMQREFGSDASGVLCGVGPCLCLECLEIGEEVATEVKSTQVESTHVARRENWQKPHLDLRAMIRDDLTSAGVLASHIETMNRCPRCENETFFSHRAQGGKAGRFGLVAWWE
jgi:YfiH family protein